MTSSLPRVVRGFSKAHYLVSVAATLMLAACSQSVERFSQNPSDADPVYTASVPKQQKMASADSGSSQDTITSRPLAGSSVNKSGTDYNYSSNYRKPAYKAPQVPQVAEVETPAARGGRSITVGSGMTLYSIARSANLTVAELAAANGLEPPYAVHSGLVLQVPGAADAVTPKVKSVSAEPARNFTAARRSASGMHEVVSGETLFSLGRKYGVSPYTIANLNGLPKNTPLKLGQRVKIPAGGTVAMTTRTKAPAAQEAAARQVANNEASPAAEPVLKTPAVAAQSPGAKPALETQQVADAGQADTPAIAAPADAAATGMRWPVRGKIISSYGSKPNGLKNEGINIAVPEGTSIRAAESGVVAYAGNELKGYGNLVLIRHEGGYVTAYAHAKELFVKRGDTVKRGDVIAKAGQTGSVSSPQLHFEVRKGATAMDPIQFLSSSTAAN